MTEGWFKALLQGGFLPHGACFLWSKPLMSLHMLSDALIAVSYYSIPFALAYFIYRRTDLVYRWMFVLVAMFIMACGTSHVFDVWTLWHPDYFAQGIVKASTAALSAATAVAMWYLMPRALALPSPAQLTQVVARLEDEIVQHQELVVRLNGEVAERRSAEEALRASEQRLELALLGADLGLWDWNIQTGAVIYNDRWITMLGYERHEVAPNYSEWERLIHPEDAPRVMEALGRLLRGETSVYEVEHRLRTKSGEWLWVLTRGKVFERDGEGNALRAAGTHMDIAARKQMEIRLQEQQDELCFAQRLTTAGELAATMAHELNQPLGAIANYAGGATFRFQHLFEQHPELGEMLETMLRLSNRASDVVAGIRDLVRKRELKRAPVHFDQMLYEVLPLVQADIQRKRIRLRLNVEPGLPAIWGQSIYLQQLVLNLLLNAIDAMNSGDIQRRDLKIWAHHLDGQIEFGISDTGPGFAPEIGERLFEPFISTKPDGIGLGLSICRTIVEAHGGTIWADSTPDQGVIWHVLLPVGDQEDSRGGA